MKPYVHLRVKSFLYSGEGKHPIIGTISGGATRTFKKFVDLSINTGLHGTRDYFTLQNTFGTTGTIEIKKNFPAGRLFSTEAKFESKTNIYWNPLAVYNLEFRLDNDNSFKVQIWKRVNAVLRFRSNAYRSTLHHKVAIGLYYYFILEYGLNWNF